jgi:hypothetical protein
VNNIKYISKNRLPTNRQVEAAKIKQPKLRTYLNPQKFSHISGEASRVAVIMQGVELLCSQYMYTIKDRLRGHELKCAASDEAQELLKIEITEARRALFTLQTYLDK